MRTLLQSFLAESNRALHLNAQLHVLGAELGGLAQLHYHRPLLMAVQQLNLGELRTIETCAVLIEHKADVLALDSFGCSALEGEVHAHSHTMCLTWPCVQVYSAVDLQRYARLRNVLGYPYLQLNGLQIREQSTSPGRFRGAEADTNPHIEFRASTPLSCAFSAFKRPVLKLDADKFTIQQQTPVAVMLALLEAKADPEATSLGLPTFHSQMQEMVSTLGCVTLLSSSVSFFARCVQPVPAVPFFCRFPSLMSTEQSAARSQRKATCEEKCL